MNHAEPLPKRIAAVFNPLVGGIPADWVVGRTAHLIEVLETVQSGHIPVITGRRGIGKTMIATCVERVAANTDRTMLEPAEAKALGLDNGRRYETFAVTFDNGNRDPYDVLSAEFCHWLQAEGREPEPGSTILELAYQVFEVYSRPVLVVVDNLRSTPTTERFSGLLKEVSRTGMAELTFVLVAREARAGDVFSRQAKEDNPNLVYHSVGAMSRNDLAALVARRFDRLDDLGISRLCAQTLAIIAHGNPYVAITIAKQAALAAAKAGTGVVSRRQVEAAAGELIVTLLG